MKVPDTEEIFVKLLIFVYPLYARRFKLVSRIRVILAGLVISIIIIYTSLYLVNFLINYPKTQLDQLRTNINSNNISFNDTLAIVNLENQYRVTLIQIFATLAQLFGGSVLLLGLYFTWKNIVISREGQITERFTRAVDQLGATDNSGDRNLEIRLGGIYALERISKESEEDYWPVMEILTSYARKNSRADDHLKENNLKNEPISLDIQAIFNVIGRRKNYPLTGELFGLNLDGCYLRKADGRFANLRGVELRKADLQDASLVSSNLWWAVLEEANFKDANLEMVNLKGTNLSFANLQNANLSFANLKNANLQSANLQNANLYKARNLSIDQLSKVKTLYNAKLDKELEKKLKEKYPALFEKPKDE